MHTLLINGNPVDYKAFSFPGGERQVRIAFGEAQVKARIKSSDDFMDAMLICSALKAQGVTTDLHVLYLPYARQDRVCYPGEALSVEVVAQMLKSTGAKLYLYDVHSQVSLQQLPDAVHYGVEELIQRTDLINKIAQGEFTLCAPDKGATIKVLKVANAAHSPHGILQGEKVRNPENGEITGMTLKGIAEGKKVLIVDDICDGGTTFREMAKVLRKAGAKEVHLWVTHGIFSKGIEALDGYIDHIYTTDSLPQVEHPKLTIINL